MGIPINPSFSLVTEKYRLAAASLALSLFFTVLVSSLEDCGSRIDPSAIALRDHDGTIVILMDSTGGNGTTVSRTNPLD